MEVISKNLLTVYSVQRQQVTPYFIFLQHIPVQVLVSSIFNQSQPIKFSSITGEERQTPPVSAVLEIVKFVFVFLSRRKIIIPITLG